MNQSSLTRRNTSHAFSKRPRHDCVTAAGMDRTGLVDPRGRSERQPDSTKRSARHRQLDLRCFRSVRTLDADQTLFTGKPQLLRLPVQNIRWRDGVVVVDLESGQTNRLTRQSLWTIRDARRSARSRISCKQPLLACRDLECAWSVARRLFGRLK